MGRRIPFGVADQVVILGLADLVLFELLSENNGLGPLEQGEENRRLIASRFLCQSTTGTGPAF